VTREQKCTIGRPLSIENLQRGLSKKQTPGTVRGKSLNEQLQSQSHLKARDFAFLRIPRKVNSQIKGSCIESILLSGAQDTTSRSCAYMDIHPS